jgi:hypothetical protein
LFFIILFFIYCLEILILDAVDLRHHVVINYSCHVTSKCFLLVGIPTVLVFHGLWNRYLLYLYIMVESLWSSAAHFSWFELDMNPVVTKMSWDLLPIFVWPFCFRRRQSYPKNTKYVKCMLRLGLVSLYGSTLKSRLDWKADIPWLIVYSMCLLL